MPDRDFPSASGAVRFLCRRTSHADYLAKPPIPPFNESAALAEIEQLNAIRAANRLPLLNVEQKLRGLC
jgi:hypothetical protein